MKDIQSERDKRNVFLNKVGIRDLRFPVEIRNRDGGVQGTIANVSLSVSLRETERGTHMSRFLENMNECGIITPEDTKDFLFKMAENLKSESAYLSMEFPFFIEKKAPVSGMPSRLDVDCSINSCVQNGRFDYELETKVPVTTLCPCSKEISEYGAHNQRAMVTVKIRAEKRIWIEELIETVENCASSEIYSLLKRPDEKYVTEKAYENPKFVEDLGRDLYVKLNNDERIKAFQIDVESMESIHNHSAFASAEKGEKTL